MKRVFLPLAILAAPVLAQPTPTPTSPPAEEGLTGGSVTDESEWQDLGIAIPAFATNADVATRTSAGSTGSLGLALGQVITADLKNNGLFKPVGPEALPRIGIEQVRAPSYETWSGRSAEMLVQGSVRAEGDGNLLVSCYLYDVALKQQLVSGAWRVGPGDWRRAAHKCADIVYARLSGESPFFDSRIAYIAETGPKNRRLKRLAVMDSDGANHRYLTTGQATALTPRYSPDYKSLLYLSYLNGNPRIYVYDLASDTQRLITQSRNPTFAPRWSPDGKWLAFLSDRDAKPQ